MAEESGKAVFGKCHICGAEGRLTFEHVPPKKAFNEGGGRVAHLQDYIDAEDGSRNVRSSKARKGFGRHTLCQRCNNETGAWYGPAYIDWAYQGAAFLGITTSLALPYHIFPARIAKQVISMFASSNGAGFFEAHKELRKFVLDRDVVGIPSKFKLYVFRTSQNSERFRTSGIVAVMDLNEGKPKVFSEMAFVPFGYILSVDSLPPERGLFDMTFFCHERFNQYRDVHLPIPTRETHSYFPGDFRDKKTWEKAIADGDAARAAAKSPSELAE